MRKNTFFNKNTNCSSERTVSKLSTGYNTLKAKYDDKEMRVKDLAAKGDLLMHDRNAILTDKNSKFFRCDKFTR